MNVALTSLYLPSGNKIGVGCQVHAPANAPVGRGRRVTEDFGWDRVCARYEATYAGKPLPTLGAAL